LSLVAEGITWFADAPAGGGPADDGIHVHVTVGAAQPNGGNNGNTNGNNPDGGTTAGAQQTGCSTTPGTPSSGAWILATLLIAWAFTRARGSMHR
jgi:MYXO-CTERM domain-containing protein